MAVTTYPIFERMSSVVDLQIRQVALKSFHYHSIGEYPYNLLITVLDAKNNAENFFKNCLTGQKTVLRAGHSYILPCHVPVKYERTPDITVVTIRFNLTLFYGLDIFNGHLNVEEIYAPEMVSFLKDSIADNCLLQSSQIKTVFALKTMMARMCLSRWPESQQNLSAHLLKYESAFQYMREHADATVGVHEMANACGMRQDVFSRAFKRDTGVAPKQYIADFLIGKISAYLLTSDLTLKEIASELNFNSEYYLSRFFKKQTKLSPREYKQQNL